MIIYLTYRLSKRCTMKHNRCGSIPWSCHHYNMSMLSSQKFRWDIMLSRILANLIMKSQQNLPRLIGNNLSFHTHTHWNPVLKHIHITSSKVILENCSHVFTPSRPLIVAIVSPQYYRHTAISTTSPILKHHEGGSSIGQGLGGILFNVASETHKVQLGCNQNQLNNKILNILKTYFITAFSFPRLLS